MMRLREAPARETDEPGVIALISLTGTTDTYGRLRRDCLATRTGAVRCRLEKERMPILRAWRGWPRRLRTWAALGIAALCAVSLPAAGRAQEPAKAPQSAEAAAPAEAIPLASELAPDASKSSRPEDLAWTKG